MKYAAQYLRSAASIIAQYDGVIPLAAFLKNYFKLNTKFGSKDRRYISRLCFVYYRTGHSINSTEVEEKIKASLFLCESSPGEWESLFTSEWFSEWDGTIETRWKFICKIFPGTDPRKLFAWIDELSNSVDPVLFSNSHLKQPDLFLRIRPGNKKQVLEKLSGHQISYQQVSETCLAIANGTKVETVLTLDKEAVVQDLNSQRVAEFFPQDIVTKLSSVPVWDCCAASGGKSLLLYDHIKNINLTVSDLRPSIIRNLKERFAQAGIKNYDSFITDLTNDESKTPGQKFNLIICDAPCSGSGTWGRTPEQLYFFSQKKIGGYSVLQKKIASNVIPHLAKEGYLLYITCSVFEKENEEVVNYIQDHSKLTLIKMELLKGYDKNADSMFAALFKLRE
jgi:16S rRNA (cytosine967-C5)-methyltransferase